MGGRQSIGERTRVTDMIEGLGYVPPRVSSRGEMNSYEAIELERWDSRPRSGGNRVSR